MQNRNSLVMLIILSIFLRKNTKIIQRKRTIQPVRGGKLSSEAKLERRWRAGMVGWRLQRGVSEGGK